MNLKSITISTTARRALLLLVLLVAGIGGHNVWARSRGQAAVEDVLQATGIIEVRAVAVASEFGGRIVEMPVAEGEEVRKGELLVQLDTALLDAQIDQAQATVGMAEAGLAQARAGVRPGEMAVAEAQLLQATTAVSVSRQAISDTQALVDNPQELNLQIAVTGAQLESARSNVDQAVAVKGLAEEDKERAEALLNEWDEGLQRVEAWQGTGEDVLDELPEGLTDHLPPDVLDAPPVDEGVYTYEEWELHVDDGIYTLYKWIDVDIPNDARLAYIPWWKAWVGVNAATTTVEGLEATLANLYAQRAHPQGMEARLDEARSAHAQAEAQRAMAKAQVDAMRAGATEEELAALEARVAQARSGVEALRQQREMLSLEAPADGTVLEVVSHPGEVAAAGATLLTLADTEEVILTVYVPQTKLGGVWVGQPVEVWVDSFPERAFEGRVAYISDEAEFTPRNVATQEERVHLVFAVEVRIPNPQHHLKPGMPADATFGG
jgi:multidrug resistance efflux pump